MSHIVAIGEQERLRGFALAGVDVAAAEDFPRVRAAWEALAPEAALVILTPAAHAALEAGTLEPRGERLWVVLPR
jgi:vacuolar-type H+-ATPase subunit F/Vma7